MNGHLAAIRGQCDGGGVQQDAVAEPFYLWFGAVSLTRESHIAEDPVVLLGRSDGRKSDRVCGGRHAEKITNMFHYSQAALLAG